MPGFNIPFTPEGCDPVTSGDGPSNTIEVARNHRFILETMEPMGERVNGLLLYLEKCERPSPEFDKIIFHSAQDEIPRPGKTHWRDVEFSFYEKLFGEENGSLTNQAASKIYDWWSSTMMDVNTSLFKAPSEYLKNVHLQMVDGDGEPIWSYFLYDCWPLKVTPSSLNYGESTIATIGVTLAYSRALERRSND